MKSLIAMALASAILLLGCGNDTTPRPDGALEADASLADDALLQPEVGECVPSAEVCDGVDNDCDGDVDEEGGYVTCGLGECRHQVMACEGGLMAECLPLESGEEVCGDGLDNDCDGSVDEGCPCGGEGDRDCGARAGTCQAGAQSCIDGLWGACQGGVGPREEACDGEDNDCDLAVDEGCPCQDGESRWCGLNGGICKQGWQRCVLGLWSACEEGVPPREMELCNGIDDTCEGGVDEGCPCVHGEARECGRSEGICTPGVQSCQYGLWGACDGAVEPRDEECNGLDDDCDGVVDEGFRVGAPCGVGACRGQMVCHDGATACHGPEPTPEDETCDGVDNDCDGLVDEEGPCLCPGLQAREATCDDGEDNDCDGLSDCDDPDCAGPLCPEACGDGWDNNGDGHIDEGCECLPGETWPCPLQMGVCAGARNWCTDEGRWVGCLYGPVYEVEETKCNDGWDNDCDGAVDCDDLSCQGLGGC